MTERGVPVVGARFAGSRRGASDAEGCSGCLGVGMVALVICSIVGWYLSPGLSNKDAMSVTAEVLLGDEKTSQEIIKPELVKEFVDELNQAQKCEDQPGIPVVGTISIHYRDGKVVSLSAIGVDTKYFRLGDKTYQRIKSTNREMFSKVGLTVSDRPQQLTDANRDAATTFWPSATQRAADGYLMSEKFIPLRAIARKPNAPMFKTKELEYPKDVIDIMNAWYPYYLFEREGAALQVGASSKTKEEDRSWVREIDCFCWTTRECINFEGPLDLFGSREDAERGANPIASEYTFTYDANFKSGVHGSRERAFQMAALPVLHREDGGYWCFVRPEGTEKGYQLCWVKWDGSNPAICCRIRTARREFEEYLTDLRRLMICWKNPEQQTTAQRQLYDHGLASMTRAETVGETALDQITARQQGIPKLTGYLEQPIESPFQYERVSKRTVRMLELSGSEVWDVNDVAYIPVEELP